MGSDIASNALPTKRTTLTFVALMTAVSNKNRFMKTLDVTKGNIRGAAPRARASFLDRGTMSLGSIGALLSLLLALLLVLLLDVVPLAVPLATCAGLTLSGTGGGAM